MSGGIYNKGGTLTINNSTISGNTGGGIGNSRTLTIRNSTLSGNAGTGIFNFYGTAGFQNSTVTTVLRVGTATSSLVGLHHRRKVSS